MRRYTSLRRSVDFSRLRQRGRRVTSAAITVYHADLQAREPLSVVGITVGKPVGKAVTRNRVRRRIAAILQSALDGRRIRLLVVARPGAATVSFNRLRSELHRALL
ncbi:MAG: ribonuclease P protein component [Candidatus Eremiobacteraeota bacterium]|nr:ribonuclease P protein component [Candidatus Eremiobacteraeota bacterium]